MLRATMGWRVANFGSKHPLYRRKWHFLMQKVIFETVVVVFIRYRQSQMNLVQIEDLT